METSDCRCKYRRSAQYPSGDHGSRGPTLYFVHQWINRQTQRRGSYLRRVYGLDPLYVYQRFSIPTGLGAFLYGRYRLDNGPQLHFVWTAYRWRHHITIRRHPHLPQPRSFLGDCRKTQCRYPLYRTHRHSELNERRKRLGNESQNAIAKSPWHRGRAHQRRSLAMVP